MLPGKKLIILVSDTSSKMNSEDWDRLFNSTAGTVDNRIYISIPAPPVNIALETETREKNYWRPKFERFKKKR